MDTIFLRSFVYNVYIYVIVDLDLLGFALSYIPYTPVLRFQFSAKQLHLRLALLLLLVLIQRNQVKVFLTKKIRS